MGAAHLTAVAVVSVIVWAAGARAASIAAPGQLVATGIPYATNVTFDARTRHVDHSSVTLALLARVTVRVARSRR